MAIRQTVLPLDGNYVVLAATGGDVAEAGSRRQVGELEVENGSDDE